MADNEPSGLSTNSLLLKKVGARKGTQKVCSGPCPW